MLPINFNNYFSLVCRKCVVYFVLLVLMLIQNVKNDNIYHWWTNNLGKADYWQLINPNQEPFFPSKFLDGDMIANLNMVCLDTKCNQLKLLLTLTNTTSGKFFMEYQMVRQNIILKDDNEHVKCLYQQYNPLFGLDDFFRNGFRFVEKIAYLYYCPDKPQKEKTIFTFYQRPLTNEFREPDLILRATYSKEANVFIILKRENKLFEGQLPPYGHNVQKHIGTDFPEVFDIDSITSTYHRLTSVNVGESLSISINYLEGINTYHAKSLFRFNRLGKPGSSQKYLPFIKVVLVHKNKYKNETQNVIYWTNLYGQLYLTDLMLRRLGYRLVVVDHQNKNMFEDDVDRRMIEQCLEYEVKYFASIHAIFQGRFEEFTAKLDFDPTQINLVIFLDEVMATCNFPEFYESYSAKMMNSLGTKTAWIAFPTNVVKEDPFAKSEEGNFHPIYSTIKKVMFGKAGEFEKPCVFDGCHQSLMGNMYYHNYKSFLWHGSLYFLRNRMLPLQYQYLKPPKDHEWDESFPVCGDGIITQNEKCECNPNGCFYFSPELLEVKESDCCNRHTCTLNSNYVCGLTDCCNSTDCSIITKKSNYVCRDSKDGCDPVEKCNGVDDSCPPDLREMNGVECGENSICWEGECARTPSSYCAMMYDYLAKVDDKNITLNTKGDENHNCGFNKTENEFIKCDPLSARCGSMYCVNDNKQKDPFPLNNWHDIKTVSKRTFPEFTNCNRDSLCIQGKCTKKQDFISNVKCPFDCHGNGKCMLKGVCLCFDYDDIIDEMICQRKIPVIISTAKPFPDFESGESNNQKPASQLNELIHNKIIWIILFAVGILVLLLLLLILKVATNKSNQNVNNSASMETNDGMLPSPVFNQQALSQQNSKKKDKQKKSILPFGKKLNNRTTNDPSSNKDVSKTNIEMPVNSLASTGFSISSKVNISKQSNTSLIDSPDAIRDKDKSTSIKKSPINITTSSVKSTTDSMM